MWVYVLINLIFLQMYVDSCVIVPNPTDKDTVAVWHYWQGLQKVHCYFWWPRAKVCCVCVLLNACEFVCLQIFLQVSPEEVAAATTCASVAPHGTPFFFIGNSIAQVGMLVELMASHKFYLNEELVLTPDAALQKYNKKNELQVSCVCGVCVVCG